MGSVLEEAPGAKNYTTVVHQIIPVPEALTEILIVEDDVVVLETLAYNLAGRGFGVHKATDGAQAPQSSPASP